MRVPRPIDENCAIAQALAVVGDWWALLIVRELAAGLTRFGDIAEALAVSRKVLSERLVALLDAGVISRSPYSEHPPRYDYRLTVKGQGLLPVLIALQNWGEQHVLGDGILTATGRVQESHRVAELVGRALPPVQVSGSLGRNVDVLGRFPPDADWTVLYCFPGAWAPSNGSNPPDWDSIPGAAGCTLEAATFRDAHDDFAAQRARVIGVSTQRPDQLAAFRTHMRLPFELLSDEQLRLAAALRLPTFRAGGVDRLKRLTLIIQNRDRRVRHVLFPVIDPIGTVADALAALSSLTATRSY